METGDENSIVSFRHPDADDGKLLWKIAGETGVLDQNSVYHYLIMCTHFKKTAMVAVADNKVCGFVTGYIQPESRETLFIWQVAVSDAFRGKGLGLSLLFRLFAGLRAEGCQFIESTITPSNHASVNLFRALAKRVGGNFLLGEIFFQESDFGSEGHEAELLCKIGPIDFKQE